jgi:hypothetical protein
VPLEDRPARHVADCIGGVPAAPPAVGAVSSADERRFAGCARARQGCQCGWRSARAVGWSARAAGSPTNL